MVWKEEFFNRRQLMKRTVLLFVLLAAVLGLVGVAQAQGPNFAVTLEKVDGLQGADTVVTGKQIRWILRVKNDSTLTFSISNGFRVYSPDGATWDSTSGDTLGRPTALLGKAFFELQYAINKFSNDGLLSDTVGFLAAKLFLGIPAHFNDTCWGVYAYNLSSGSAGKHICIDSAWFRPGGTWKWAASGGINKFPSWDGPHCYVITTPLAVSELGNELPAKFALTQNYPNPFNPTTEIEFDIPRNSQVNLTVFNVLGQKVKTLVNEMLVAKKYKVDWDGTSDSGTKVASGIYFYKLEAGDFVQTKKMVMLK
jgi:hypothetical protein